MADTDTHGAATGDEVSAAEAASCLQHLRRRRRSAAPTDAALKQCRCAAAAAMPHLGLRDKVGETPVFDYDVGTGFGVGALSVFGQPATIEPKNRLAPLTLLAHSDPLPDAHRVRPGELF